jgi:hypothetical protein
MPIDGLTPEALREQIKRVEERKASALAEYESAKAELAWLEQGLRLFDPDASDLKAGENDHDAIVTELFPAGVTFENGAKPTLRQAIVLVMREEQHIGRWTPARLAEALAYHGWLPTREASKDATKRVSDMAGIMFNDGQLSRLDRGIYKLAPALAAALEARGDDF